MLFLSLRALLLTALGTHALACNSNGDPEADSAPLGAAGAPATGSSTGSNSALGPTATTATTSAPGTGSVGVTGTTSTAAPSATDTASPTTSATTPQGSVIPTGGVGGSGEAPSASATGSVDLGDAGADEQPPLPEDDVLSPRTRLHLRDGWKFTKGDPSGVTGLGYSAVKSWVLPTGNRFLADEGAQVQRPAGELGADVSYVARQFDDTAWAGVEVPHDYAIAGPFTDSISSSMGRLPSIGVAWYRKVVSLPADAAGKSAFLDLDGAMSYSMVWVNGVFVGGWPYGYASYRLDLSDYVQAGQDNVIAVRLDNPTPEGANWDQGSSRWYPGAGLYRNVWLTTTDPVHVAQWGTHLTTNDVSSTSARVELAVSIDNDTDQDVSVSIATELFELDAAGAKQGAAVAQLDATELLVPAGKSATAESSTTLSNPKLWGTPPEQTPNRYVAVTRVSREGEVVDAYETRFGVRSIEFTGDRGFLLNGQHVKLRGVCNHHDLGALGAAMNTRALQRQLEILQEMGSNAIRTSHNPPAPELLELADRMGFVIMDEAFDVWEKGKAALDHHLFFADWHEQDLRALIRRDRNHPSVVMWSIGNEIVEQNDNTAGPAMGQKLSAIAHEEDSTRPTVSGMNSAKPDNPFSGPIDSIGLNYQGTGVRSGPAQYPTYHSSFPDKFIVGTETVSTFSTRGSYFFPVASGRGQTASDSPGISGGEISSYDLYSADWSYSPDAEFESQDKYGYVGGEFVWTGFDYLGEPTPLDSVARSSYFGIIDLAGFPKDRFYLYQANWRPDLPMAHLLPHWTWPDREGEVTPVHVYTSGDEAELFLNGTSLGRKARQQYDYRLRWDDVVYEAGELAVVAYKDGAEWATDVVTTTGSASKLLLEADRVAIASDGKDLSFVTLRVADADGRVVPRSMNEIQFAVSGPGEIVATDNGDPTDRTVFPSHDRKAFNGLALVIVRAQPGQAGTIVVSASADGLTAASVMIDAE